MNKTLASVRDSLNSLLKKVQASIPTDDPLNIAQGHWAFPGITKSDLSEEIQQLIDVIESQGKEDIGDHEVLLNDYVRRINFLRDNTVHQMWGNAGQAVPAYLTTLSCLRRALEPALDQSSHRQAVVKLKRVGTQIRSMEATLNTLAPRTETLDSMLQQIEAAHETAEQLPTDLETLAEAQQKIGRLVLEATKEQARLLDIREKAEALDKKLRESADSAGAVLERCESAYAAATSVGLAAAFNERSNSLSKSMWFWVSGLVVALSLGSYLGARQLSTLSSLFETPDTSAPIILLNLVLSILSVGAPVWFAWLATKQIGQRFRLSEDYAFKASISRAYEGFRKEAARFDSDMEERLLESALARLDELPLRLVETDSHGSPWHELISSDVVKHAMKTVPGFTGEIKKLAKRLATFTPSKSNAKKTDEESDGK